MAEGSNVAMVRVGSSKRHPARALGVNMAVEDLPNFDVWLKALHHLKEAADRLSEAREKNAPDFEAAKHDFLKAKEAYEAIEIG